MVDTDTPACLFQTLC